MDPCPSPPNPSGVSSLYFHLRVSSRCEGRYNTLIQLAVSLGLLRGYARTVRTEGGRGAPAAPSLSGGCVLRWIQGRRSSGAPKIQIRLSHIFPRPYSTAGGSRGATRRSRNIFRGELILVHRTIAPLRARTETHVRKTAISHRATQQPLGIFLAIVTVASSKPLYNYLINYYNFLGWRKRLHKK